jgi:hypothetical protein
MNGASAMDTLEVESGCLAVGRGSDGEDGDGMGDGENNGVGVGCGGVSGVTICLASLRFPDAKKYCHTPPIVIVNTANVTNAIRRIFV